MNIIQLKSYLLLVLLCLGVGLNSYAENEQYIQVTGVMDICTDYSNGAHSFVYLGNKAKVRGIDALFFNDHDLVTMEWGIRPFENLIKYKVKKASILKNGPERYLQMIQAASKQFPEVIFIPGSESSPYYYWKGFPFINNLTVNDWERHLLIVGFDSPQDYEDLPLLHNKYSKKFVLQSLSPGLFLLFIPVLLGIFLLKKKRKMRYLGIALLVFSLLMLIDELPFKSSPYDQYQGDQGISPYQEMIDYVSSREGMIFWNHPETKSGKGQLNKFVYRDTPPYPQVLLESKDYTGFAAIYPDNITITEPGEIWDQVLEEYCSGKRLAPIWGISSSNYHDEGEPGENLGNCLNIFIVKNKSKEEILEALKKGRFYAYRGRISIPKLILEEFSIFDSDTSQLGIMGEVVSFKGKPNVKIRITSDDMDKDTVITVRLIRDGLLIKTYKSEGLLDINFLDEAVQSGKKIYYRLDVRDNKGRTIVSNPIFLQF